MAARVAMASVLVSAMAPVAIAVVLLAMDRAAAPVVMALADLADLAATVLPEVRVAMTVREIPAAPLGGRMNRRPSARSSPRPSFLTTPNLNCSAAR